MKKYLNWKSIVVTIAAIFFIIGGIVVYTSNQQTVSNPNITAQSKVAKDLTDTNNGSNSSATTANDGKTSTVYMTKDISPEGIKAVYEALNKKATGNVAIKLHTGEAGDTYYLSPDLIKDFIHSVNGTIVECNTAYAGSKRADTAMHLQVAADHGFTSIANVDILDSEDSISLPVIGGKHLSEDQVGSHLQNYDFVVVLSHFKGHTMGGFGGAIKNMSIGIASKSGKNLIHSAGKTISGPWTGIQDNFLESMAEAAKAVADYEGENILYISVMNNLSVDCDCDSNPAKPTMKDIGILASLDPVALDQACVDLVYAAPDGKDLIKRIELRNGIHTIEYANQIGLGSRKYELVKIDD